MTRLETDLDRIRTLTADIRELQQAQALLVGERKELLRNLHRSGISLRDLAVEVGVTFQRVGQLVNVQTP